jgi:hypothetical protein
VVHEDRGHRGTSCTLLPLAATFWLVFRYSVRESTSSPYATLVACAVEHEDRGHRGTFCTYLPLAATSWQVCRYSTRESTSSLYAAAFACAMVQEVRGHGGTFCTLMPLAATAWLVGLRIMRGRASFVRHRLWLSRDAKHVPTGERPTLFSRWQHSLACVSKIRSWRSVPIPIKFPRRWATILSCHASLASVCNIRANLQSYSIQARRQQPAR